jgi:UDP-hydrolysing UDP-N-acetyl-D-glucosamine 2-epimerase
MTGRRWRIGVVTTSRADFGIYQSVLKALTAASDIEFGLLVTGMHMSPEFGLTRTIIDDSGYPVWDRLETLLSSDTEIGVAKSMALTTLAFADCLGRHHLDLLLVLGDRFEMHAAALAAVPLRIPLAHIHGGEETIGAIDNVFRHSLTKISSLHFPATELSAERIRQMGEAGENVIVAGAPALDTIQSAAVMTRAELAQKFDLPESGPFMLATYHPATLTPGSTFEELDGLWAAVRDAADPIVFTLANADPAGREVNGRLRAFADERPKTTTIVGTMGVDGYFSAMRSARVMVGNSSSGILEAASFGLPVVNIGERQRGRERSSNVIDVPGTARDIRDGLQRAISDEFREQIADCRNVYGDGRAAERIISGIQSFLGRGGRVAKEFQLMDSK